MHPGFLKKDLSTFTISKTDSSDIVAYTLQVSQAPFSVVQTSFQRFFSFPRLVWKMAPIDTGKARQW